MHRKSTVSVMAIGAVVSLLLGSGLLSIVSDSVTSEGNSLESGEFTPPAHDLQAQLTLGACSSQSDYSDGPLTAMVSTPEGTPNVTLDGAHFGGDRRLCLKNAGSRAGQVLLRFDSIVDSEVGQCSSSESDPDQGADTSCLDGDQGELSSILYVSFLVRPGDTTSDSCASTASFFFGDYGNPDVFGVGYPVDSSLAPGEVCALDLDYSVGRDDFVTPEQQKFAAQTDRVQWDIVATLQDVPS